jgi:hypothetical protein
LRAECQHGRSVRIKKTGCLKRRTLRAEELARDVESLAADDNDLLAVEELLGNNGSKTAEEVALAVDDDL